MSKRLQVLLEPREYRSFQQIAKEAKMSLGEWVRQSLRKMATARAERDPRKKLDGVRKASHFNYPTGDIHQILAEIEKGYLGL